MSALREHARADKWTFSPAASGSVRSCHSGSPERDNSETAEGSSSASASVDRNWSRWIVRRWGARARTVAGIATGHHQLPAGMYRQHLDWTGVQHDRLAADALGRRTADSSNDLCGSAWSWNAGLGRCAMNEVTPEGESDEEVSFLC